MTSNKERGDPFLWPYEPAGQSGPLGNSAAEVTEIERLVEAVQRTEVYPLQQPNVSNIELHAPGIATNLLVDLDEWR